MSAEWLPVEQSPESGQERPEGPGALLRASREARGLSLAQAADQLKLKQAIIDALESDDYQRLPSILFARGYLRSYARLLGLPVTEVIETFERLGLIEARPALPKGAILTNKQRSEHLLLRWGSVAVVVVLGVLLVAWFQDESTSSLLSRLGINGSPGSAALTPAQVELPAHPPVAEANSESTPAFVPPPVVPEPAPKKPPLAEPSPEVVMAPDPTPPIVASTPSTPMVAEPPEPAPAVVSRPDPAISSMPEPMADPVAAALPAVVTPVTRSDAADSGGDRLVLELLGDSWAEVTDVNGERLVYQLLKAGTVREVTGQGPFAIFLGNAPGVELRFNGEPVTDIRASSRGVARLTLGAAPDGER